MCVYWTWFCFPSFNSWSPTQKKRNGLTDDAYHQPPNTALASHLWSYLATYSLFGKKERPMGCTVRMYRWLLLNSEQCGIGPDSDINRKTFVIKRAIENGQLLVNHGSTERLWTCNLQCLRFSNARWIRDYGNWTFVQFCFLKSLSYRNNWRDHKAIWRFCEFSCRTHIGIPTSIWRIKRIWTLDDWIQVPVFGALSIGVLLAFIC